MRAFEVYGAYDLGDMAPTGAMSVGWCHYFMTDCSYVRMGSRSIKQPFHRAATLHNWLSLCGQAVTCFLSVTCMVIVNCASSGHF